MRPTCEWCGQPASSTNPALCAECYFKYWEKTRIFGLPDRLPGYSVLADRRARDGRGT